GDVVAVGVEGAGPPGRGEGGGGGPPLGLVARLVCLGPGALVVGPQLGPGLEQNAAGKGGGTPAGPRNRASAPPPPGPADRAANGRASNTTRTEAILPPSSWNHSATKEVPATLVFMS